MLCTGLRKRRLLSQVTLTDCFLEAFEKFQKAAISFVMSVFMSVCPPARNNSAPTRRIFKKCYIWVLFENLSKNLTRITGTLHENQHIFMIISRSILLRKRNVSDRTRTGNKNTHFITNNFLLKGTVYEIVWKNIVQPDRTMWRITTARWYLRLQTHS